MVNPKNDSPHSLLIFFSLNSKELESLLEEARFMKEKHLDKKEIFGKFEKITILEDHSLTVRKKARFKFFIKSDFINQPKISIELIHLSAKTPTKNDRNSLYFVKLDIYYRYSLDYSSFIKNSRSNKDLLFNFLKYVMKDSNLDRDYKHLLSLIIKFKDAVPFIHFNILYYNYQKENKVVISTYRTGKEIYNNPDLEIYYGNVNYTLLFINRIKQSNSGVHLKVYATRAFLITLFAWFNRTSIKLETLH